MATTQGCLELAIELTESELRKLVKRSKEAVDCETIEPRLVLEFTARAAKLRVLESQMGKDMIPEIDWSLASPEELLILQELQERTLNARRAK